VNRSRADNPVFGLGTWLHGLQREQRLLAIHHGTRNWHRRLEGPFGVLILMLGTSPSPSEVNDLLKQVGESFREITGFEGSHHCRWLQTTCKFWYIHSFLLLETHY
jgi:hypothetical protein